MLIGNVGLQLRFCRLLDRLGLRSRVKEQRRVDFIGDNAGGLHDHAVSHRTDFFVIQRGQNVGDKVGAGNPVVIVRKQRHQNIRR
ncbi:hypothetical protein D3C80_2029370 [compost metagenome]